MNYVMPIEDRKMVGVIGDYLREKNERDYVLFMTGVYRGRRISDILQYRVKDLRGKDRIAIEEQKTGETILLPINPNLQKIYKEYFKGKRDYEFAFRNSRSRQNTPISRIRVWQILKEAAEAVGYIRQSELSHPQKNLCLLAVYGHRRRHRDGAGGAGSFGSKYHKALHRYRSAEERKSNQ